MVLKRTSCRGLYIRYRIFVTAFLFPISVLAAGFGREIAPDNIDLISVVGTFADGDDVTFRRLVAESDRAVVVLNIGGGNLRSELQIGKAIRLRGFASAVPTGALCASACALTWLAGSPRLLDAESKLVSQAAYRLVDGKASVSGAANVIVGRDSNSRKSLSLVRKILAYQSDI